MTPFKMSLYRSLRSKGWTARMAFFAAKAQAEFDALGDDNVRIRIEPDEDADFANLKGDMFDPRHHPTVPVERLKREEKEFEATVNREGVWGFIAEYKDARTGEWEHADSCWGFVGEDDPVNSGAVYDGMHAAVASWRDSQAAMHVYDVEPGRCITRNGIPIAYISMITNHPQRPAISPAEVDELARRIAYLLNRYGAH